MNHPLHCLHRVCVFVLILVLSTPLSPAQTVPTGDQSQSYVPQQPTQSTRPSSWPGGSGESTPWVPPNQRNIQSEIQPLPANNMTRCPGTRIIARVGSEVILESEISNIIFAVDQALAQFKGKVPDEQLEARRKLEIQHGLNNFIETKLVMLDAKRTIPAEGWPRIQEQLEDEFEENQLKRMIESAKVADRHELDKKLRSLGTSLEQEKRTFCTRALAAEWIRQQVKSDEKITIDRMIGYYHEHIEEYTHPARARWEELMIRFDDHPSKEAARDELVRLGNQVLLGGVPFAEAAKRGSQGPTAAEGGARQWTTKGSLVCKEIDHALFTLPINQLSPIIEGPTGWHIVRVVEREDQHATPFRDAQVKIREKISGQQRKKQTQEYMAKLKAQTHVWTIFDEPENQTLISSRPGQIQK